MNKFEKPQSIICDSSFFVVIMGGSDPRVPFDFFLLISS